MSAQERKDAGKTAPVTPQRPEGGFSRFLRKLFEVPLESQHTQQPIQPAPITIMQFPPELSDFAIKLNKGVTNGLDLARQAEFERVNQEKQSVERSARAKEAERQKRDILTKSGIGKLEEIKEIAEGFGIRARLAHINATVWEGKGQIRDISTPPEFATKLFLSDSGDYDLRVLHAGYELVYAWERPTKERKYHPYFKNNPASFNKGYSWRYITGEDSTSLSVIIGYSYPDGRCTDDLIPINQIKGMYVSVSSDFKSQYIEKFDKRNVFLPKEERECFTSLGFNTLERDGIEKELEQFLIAESTERVRARVTPSVLSLLGQEELRQAKSSPQWHRWEYVQTYFYEND